MGWFLFISFIIFPVIQSVLTQNIEGVQQSRVLYNYMNNKDTTPKISPLFTGPFNAFLASILRRPTTTTTAAPLEPPLRDCPSCRCGLINVKRRIVGGHDTLKQQYPWMAMLLRRGRFFCSGSLINDYYVLTAAHCVINSDKSVITIRLLPHDLLSADADTVDRKIDKVILNRFNMITFANDIGLIKLNEPIEMTKILRPVCLPSLSSSFAGENGIVTGWGTLVEKGQPVNDLQEVSVPILSNDECRKRFPEVTDNMMCAGEKEGGKDACQGDSGGPLHVVEGLQYIEAGIVSWGVGCAQPGNPGVYTRVSGYYDWIKSNTRDACYCT